MTLKATILTTLMGLALGFGISAANANPAKPMTYVRFAEKVPHLTLSECPEFVNATEVDCHVARFDGELHVLAFATAGDQRLVAVHSERGNLDIGSFLLGAFY